MEQSVSPPRLTSIFVSTRFYWDDVSMVSSVWCPCHNALLCYPEEKSIHLLQDVRRKEPGELCGWRCKGQWRHVTQGFSKSESTKETSGISRNLTNVMSINTCSELCILLCALKDGLGKCRVRLHGRSDQRGEERQVPDGWSIRNRHLFILGNLITQRLQAVNPCVASITQAPLNVDLDVWDLVTSLCG